VFYSTQITIFNRVVSKSLEQVSDYRLFQVRMGATKGNSRPLK